MGMAEVLNFLLAVVASVVGSYIVNAVILPPMWAWAEVGAVNSAFWAACGFNALTFIPGEALACYVLGTVLLKALPQIGYFKPAMRQAAQQ